MKFTKLSKSTANPKRKIVRIALAALLVLAVSVYVTLSVLMWRGYSDIAGEEIDTTHKKLTAAVAQPLGENIAAKDKRASLANATSDIRKRIDTLCQPPALIAWQTAIPAARQAVDDCDRRADITRNTVKHVDSSLEHLEAEAKLADVIMTAHQRSAELASDSKNWSELSEIWQQAAATTDKIAVNDDFAPVTQTAKQKLSTLSDAWRNLAEADKTQDQVKFGEARDNLNKVYTELDDIEASSQAAFEKVTS